MDNLTHSLAGLLLAEAALIFGREPGTAPPRGVRWAACAASIAANNFPDLDFAYTSLTSPRALGYLLHHRGHTHTLPIALLLGGVTLAITLAALHWRRVGLTAGDRRRLIALCALGPLIHVAMDFTNNYGVHPFWPAYDGWFYGDSVFIVEPWLWVAMLPPLVFSARSRVGRATLIAIGVAGLALSWAVSLLPWGAALALTAGAALASFSCWKLSPRARVTQGLVAYAAATLVFATASRVAEAAVEDAMARARPGATLLDVVVTPAPANPLCSSAIAIATEGDRYSLTKAAVATWPGVLSAAHCRLESSTPTAPLATVRSAAEPSVAWKGEWSGSRAALTRLARENCEIDALLRFARAPYWVARDDGWIAGDLRYDRSPEIDFADLRTSSRPERCPQWVPPWKPPRSDLLGAP